MPHSQVAHVTRSNAKRMRKAMTEAEAKLLQELRAHRLEGLGFRRQMPIEAYIADFACVEHKLIVEVDGSHHAEGEQLTHDEKRTIYLKEQGWTVLRFWNDDVLKDINNVCQHIISVLQERGADFK